MLGNAVLILNYNDCVGTENLVKSIVDYSEIDFILIVDNCSVDNSYEVLKKLENNKIKVLKTKSNGGYAKGNNFGMKYLAENGYKRVFLSNTDVSFSESFVGECTKYLKSGYSAVSGIMASRKGFRSPAGNYFIGPFEEDLYDCFYLLWKFFKRPVTARYRYPSGEKIMDAEKLPGSLFAVNTEDFIKVGGFDENTFLYCEERILGRRYKKAGLKMGVILNEVYIHNYSSVVSRELSNYSIMKNLYDSRRYYYRKYEKISLPKYIFYSFMCNVSLAEVYIYGTLKKFKKERS